MTGVLIGPAHESRSRRAASAHCAVLDAIEMGSSTSLTTDPSNEGSSQPGARITAATAQHDRCLVITSRVAVGRGSCKVSACAKLAMAYFPAEWTCASTVPLVYHRVPPTATGHFTPFEAGFSLSSGSDPTKDVILRLEAESNEETKVSEPLEQSNES